MKKIITIIALAAITAFCASAQTNSWHKKGYSFDVELATTKAFDQNAFSTSHGYSFGNGLFLGGGAAFEYVVSESTYMTPVFAEARWSVLDKTISPYIDARAGYMIIADHANSFYFSPTIGLDIWKLNAFIGWDIIPALKGGFKFGIGLHF